MSVGDRVEIKSNGYCGTITRITSKGTWVRVRSRWGNHHHPKTNRTFRVPMSDLEKIEPCTN